jgi:phosphonate transport system substrate-binding protein
MPQYFLDQAGIGPDGFNGEPGFSGSHDATVDAVQSGSFEGGALNLQVWERRLAEGTVDTTKVVEVFRTPTYHDYHWILQPSAVERYGEGFADEVQAALTGLSVDDPAQAEVLDLFGATSFVPADASDYGQIEEIGRKLGLITS